MAINRIENLQTLTGSGVEAFVRNLLAAQRIPVVPPTRLEPGHARRAVVNHGRWIAHCPCGGAELVDLEDPRMYCLSCHNEEAGGEWLAVVLPDEPQEIEAELLRRSTIATRNWEGESIEQLRAELEEHS